MSGCSATSVSVYENCGAPPMGLASYNPLDPNAAAIRAAVAQSKPSGAPSGYPITCEAMLRAGGMIYWRTSPGDCPAPTAPGGITSGQIVGMSGTAASGVIGALGAAGTLAGPATLGISTAVSLAVSAIEGIFQHHDIAVANEQQTICQVAQFFNQAKRSIDNAVRAGQITPDEGVAYLTQICNQAKTGLASIMKSCNAACVFQGVAQAFINYARTWYDSISPTVGAFAQAPGGPPSGYGTPPGGVTVSPSSLAPPPPIRTLAPTTYAPTNLSSASLTPNSALSGSGAPDNLNQGYNQQTGQSAQAADVPPGSTNWGAVAAIAAVLALVITLVSARG
jgi:hypothetical protein